MTEPQLTKLISRCRRGDGSAQRQLYESYLPYVLTILRRFGVAEHEWADLVQEVFIAAFGSLKKFDPQRGKFNSWLSRITVNKTLDFLRKRSAFTFTDLDAIEPGHYATEPLFDDPHAPPEYLLRLIARLPAGYRTVFNLYAVDGYSHAEIAERLSISEVASRSQFSRARAALRTAVTSYNHQSKSYGTF
ncbi:MAG: sigma-70 family RNA polymerase sigma factor [Saprospiraceae bacterium]